MIYPPPREEPKCPLCFLTGELRSSRRPSSRCFSLLSSKMCLLKMLRPTLRPKSFQHRSNIASHLSENNIRKTIKYTFDNWCEEWIYSLLWHKSASAFTGRNVSCVISQQQQHILDTFISGSLNSAHAWTHMKFPTCDTSPPPLRTEFMRVPLYSI